MFVFENIASFERLNGVVVKLWRGKVSYTFTTISQMLFEQKIIGGCYMVVLIGFDASQSIFEIKVKCFEFLQNFQLVQKCPPVKLVLL